MVSAYTNDGVQVLKAQSRNRWLEYLVMPGMLTVFPILYFLISLPHMINERKKARGA